MWQFFDGTHEPELPTTGSLIAHGQTVIDWNTLDPANQSTWDRLTKDKTPLFPDSSVMLRATNTHSNQLYFVPASVHFLNSSLAAHPSNQLRDVLETYTANYTDFEFKASGQTGADNLARGQSRVHQALAQEALKSLNDLSKLFLLAKTDLKVKQETAVLGNFDLQLKTLYLHDDVFETSSYQRVLDNASRIAGFFDSPSALGTVRAAGIFVGPNVVLTCQHCLAVLHPGTSAICRRIPGSTSPIVYLYKNPLPDYRRASA